MTRINVKRVGKKASGDGASAIVLNGVSSRVIASKKAARTAVLAALPASASAPPVPYGAKDGSVHTWSDEGGEKS